MGMKENPSNSFRKGSSRVVKIGVRTANPTKINQEKSHQLMGDGFGAGIRVGPESIPDEITNDSQGE